MGLNHSISTDPTHSERIRCLTTVRPARRIVWLRSIDERSYTKVRNRTPFLANTCDATARHTSTSPVHQLSRTSKAFGIIATIEFHVHRIRYLHQSRRLFELHRTYDLLHHRRAYRADATT